ncbi:ferredoxin [Shimia sp. R10_1]|uniref:ferredoxin n=1 Tax=Shimia sp. R10_1 TaxID=2821095 RepID=UPI001AD95637|nr:ferredoxin [Shimia sp. R10_1]MBO9472766.1 ferredoxin [Shimia sp. R10_1]
MSYRALEKAARNAGLITMGAAHIQSQTGVADDPATVVLVGTGADFWPIFSTSEEGQDGHPHPVDRWSKRIVGALADQFDATTAYPSDGPPYPPFISWALKTNRFFLSPVGMMVHDTVGLMISMRGALLFDTEVAIPTADLASPCTACKAPCTTVCPVGALSAGAAYNVTACHSHLDTSEGQSCMSQGCHARRACPISAGACRTDAQSALHMKAFHPCATP